MTLWDSSNTSLVLANWINGDYLSGYLEIQFCFQFVKSVLAFISNEYKTLEEIYNTWGSVNPKWFSGLLTQGNHIRAKVFNQNSLRWTVQSLWCLLGSMQFPDFLVTSVQDPQSRRNVYCQPRGVWKICSDSLGHSQKEKYSGLIHYTVINYFEWLIHNHAQSDQGQDMYLDIFCPERERDWISFFILKDETGSSCHKMTPFDIETLLIACLLGSSTKYMNLPCLQVFKVHF